MEAHAYIQCGVSMLKRLLGGGEGGAGVADGGGASAVLEVELLYAVEGGAEESGGNGEAVRCRCQVCIKLDTSRQAVGIMNPGIRDKKSMRVPGARRDDTCNHG